MKWGREVYKSKVSICVFAPTIDTASASLWFTLSSWYLVFYCNKLATHTQAWLYPLYSSYTGPSCPPHLSCLRDFTQLLLPGMCAVYTWPLPIKHTHAAWLTSFLHCSRIGVNVTSSKSLPRCLLYSFSHYAPSAICLPSEGLSVLYLPPPFQLEEPWS